MPHNMALQAEKLPATPSIFSLSAGVMWQGLKESGLKGTLPLIRINEPSFLVDFAVTKLEQDG
jgi:hypothetical protein